MTTTMRLLTLLFIAICVVDTCLASTTLVVCGSHGTNGGGDPPRQCMKVRPLGDKVLLTSIPVGTCQQIDPPSLQLEAGPANDSQEQSSRLGHNERKPGDRNRRRLLPKKLFVGGLNFDEDEPMFHLEMDMNEDTAVWWDHVQEQDDGCRTDGGQTREEVSLRLEQVDVVVGEDTIDCDNTYIDGSNEVRSRGQLQVRLILKDVLVISVDLILATEGNAIRQSVSLHPKSVELFVTDGSTPTSNLVKRWQRQA